MPKNRLTVEEFLKFKPIRGNFPWNKNEDGIVVIQVPKFQGKLGKTFCKLLKKENIFYANLDEIGSLVWEYCDGKHTVEEILEVLKQNFPDEENLDQRLFLFLRQMQALNYLIF